MSYTLIRNGTLIDGQGGNPLKDAAVLIEGNTIRAVGTSADIRLPDAEIIMVDAGGGAILPGMIDTHVHVMLEGVNMQKMMKTPFSLNFFKAAQYLRRTLDAGITSVRDAGGADAGVKAAVEQGYIRGPRMQISVMPMTITGGHGDGWMLSGHTFEFLASHPGLPSGLCDGVDEVRKKAREILRAGADIIKVHATGGVLSPTDHPEFTQFSPEELAAIVQEGAYRRGVKVMAHAQGSEGVKNAILAGIHSIEHGIYLTDEIIELMVERGTFLVPTLLAPIAVLEYAEEFNMPEHGVRKAQEVIEIHAESIARAYKGGAQIAMGTDAGVMPHGTNLRELDLMMNIGMSAMESIVATTKVAAECLGWDDRLGTVEVGKLADIIITKRDPLTDIRSLEDNDNIVMVMKDGVVEKDLLG